MQIQECATDLDKNTLMQSHTTRRHIRTKHNLSTESLTRHTIDIHGHENENRH